MPDNRSSSPSSVAVLVNDDPLQLTLQRNLLEKEGFTIRTFPSAEGALEAMAGEAPPDLIITDLYMPGIDGWRFCRLLRSPEFLALNRVPILVVSATFGGDEPDRIAADLGVEGFLSCPFEPHHFIQQVHAIRTGRQHRVPLRALIVEDSRTMGSMLQMAFQDHGYAADLATTLKEAGAALAGVAYDVAVIDYHLPDGCGDTLLDQLQETRSGCVALMMTTDPSPDLALGWMKRGAADYLRKPFRSEFLLELCARARRERSLMRVEDLLEARTRELRANEEKFRLIAENTSDGLLVLSPEHRVLYASPSFSRMLDQPAAEADGKGAELLFGGVHPEERAELCRRYQEAISGGEAELNYSCKVEGTSGRSFWREDHARFVYGEDGSHQSTYLVCRDITERRVHEGEIEYTNRLYEMLSQVGRALLDAQDRATLFQTICEIALEKGQFPLAWIGWVDKGTATLKPVACAGTGRAFVEGLSQFLGEGAEYLGPVGICVTEGRPVVSQSLLADLRSAPWKAKAEALGLLSGATLPIFINDEVAGTLTVYSGEPGGFKARDVALLGETASHISFGLEHLAYIETQAQLQLQLMQSQKMESLGVLAGGVAHDMNNVLGAILGFAEANLASQPAGSRAHRAFETISKAATRGGKLVKSLLGFARRSPVEERELDVNALLREEVILLERTTFSKVRLELDLEPELRPISGDASALSHALMNLCVNAVDAMPDSGTLTLRTKNIDEEWIEVEVADTGCGMPREVLEKALDPFFTTKGVGKGTGLGLSTVYTTVKAHKGQLDIDSRPGAGTRVKLRFPTLEGTFEGVAPAGEPQAEPSGTKLTVLVVDDDELIQWSILAVLEEMGHTATAASSGEEALARLEGGLHPDVITLDMNMPGLGGAGTLPRLRALRPLVPVILSTGRADQTALDLVAAHPHVTLLPKPFHLAELEAFLEVLARDGELHAHPS